jgi:type III restriction enzyme
LKLQLKDFQINTVGELYARARAARREVAEEGGEQAIVLASPTGSGKTVIATALMERLIEGDEKNAPDEDATFLWLTDQPDLNEQSRRKISAASATFSNDDLVTLDADFDSERLEPGKVYFLNIQKLGAGTKLTTPGDDREHTIWQTIANTVAATPGSFWLVLDEAHKGMLEGREATEATSIAQKFIKGSPGEIPAIPLILGISATPDRFVELLKGTSRTRREVTVDPEAVRASGLLKETIVLYHPTERQPSDWSLLRASAEKLKRYAEQWAGYCGKEKEPPVDPILVVQVEDGSDNAISKTSLEEALVVLDEVLGDLSDEEVAHSFQEGHAVEVGDRALRYVSPADIQDDEQLRVVFFKLSLNTGWDCPRAEVIMSFRRALDYTRIAQLVGRLVRTPLARSVASNDFLNGVSLYLPHYDKKALNAVIDYLSKPETGLAVAPEFVEGDDLIELERAADKGDLFELAATLPTYAIERIAKASNVRRLARLGRALTYDKLDPGAAEQFRELVVSALDTERKRLEKNASFKKTLKDRAEIDVRGVSVVYRGGAEGPPDESFEAVAAVSQNVDDLYAQAGRKLGEGLHAAYLKARVATGKIKPSTAKLELAALLDDEKTVKALEEMSGKTFNAEAEKHKAAIRDLPEARREAYRKLRRQAAKPEPEELELPDIYQSVIDEDGIFSGHLYADAKGLFSFSPNEWERATVEAELARDDVLGWLRNVPRKSWAFKLPYRYDGDDTAAMYPDFLFFRRQGAGVVVDILEPHRLTQDDSAAKAVGLADFATRHGDRFGRIELIIKEKDKLLRLDVNRGDVRDKVRAVKDNGHLRQLFESAG